MIRPNLKTIADYKKFSELFIKLPIKEQNLVLRDMLRNDLFFLLTIGLKRKDACHQWILDRCKEVEAEPNECLDLWARGHYKMQRLDEPTPVPSGWKKHGDLEVGDDVFSADGTICKVIATSPVWHDGECFEIEFDDGEAIECGADHLWEIERRTRKRIKGTWKNDGIGKRQYRESVVVNTRDIFEHNHKADNRYCIKVAAPLELPEECLPIDPYTLGVWLGDGTSSNGDITCRSSEIWNKIQAAKYEIGVDKYKDHKSRCHRVVGLHAQLKELNLTKNKHIPAQYLRASFKQRLQLIQGLMDTDGHCSFASTATFCNKNERLIDDTLELAHTLGFKPRKYTYKAEHGEYWHVAFQGYKETPPFSLSRKLKRCKEGERPNPRRMIVGCRKIASKPMSCIQVDRDDGLYLTSKSFIPTHNSTIITFALTIQDILSSHGNNPDPRWKGVETTIGIFSCTKPIAKQFLAQIKREFENNEVLRGAFPDVIWENPDREAPSWSLDAGIILKRKSNPKEATIEAWGIVEGQPTSKHFFECIYDDMVTIENVRSPEMIAKTTDAWALSLNLSTDGGIKRYIGTRYHFNDTYQDMIKRESVKLRIHTATIDGKVNGEPVLLTRKSLEEKRRSMGPYTFNAQMLQNPVADENQGFKRDWLLFHESDDFSKMNRYIIIDPANSKKKTSDYTAMVVVGLSGDDNYYVLDWVRDRLSLTERTDMIFKLYKKYKPKLVVYERYGMQADISHIQDVQKRMNYNFKIVEVGGRLSKVDRVRQLIPLFEQSRIYLPSTCYRTNLEGKTQDLTEVFINEEYCNFPVSQHDDMIDALARIVDPALKLKWPILEDVAEERYQNSYRESQGSCWSA